MPANIDRMAYVGGVPWHGQGIKLPSLATWADLQAEGIFYTAEERPVYVAGLPPAASGDYHGIVRPDTGALLAIVGRRYRVIQFSELAETVMQAVGQEAAFETAGTLGSNGERGWLLGKLPVPVRVRGDESETLAYFLAHTTHDGSGAAALLPTAIRVVCQNTANAALADARRHARLLTIRHTSSAPLKLQAAKQAFGEVVRAHERFGALANMLAAVHFSDAQVGEVLDACLPLKRKAAEAEEAAEDEDGEGGGKRTEAAREKIRDLYERGQGLLPPARGTGWALFNAFTDFADHYRTVRVSDRSADKSGARFNSAVFGAGAGLKERAAVAIRDAAGIKVG